MCRLLLVLMFVGVLGLAACGAEPTPTPKVMESPLAAPTPESDALRSPVGLPNPASQFCEEKGYQLEIRTEAGGSVGYCIFPDGSECEEWAFYRGDCGPGTPSP